MGGCYVPEHSSGWGLKSWLRAKTERVNGVRETSPCSGRGTPLCRRKLTMRASTRLLFAIAFIGGVDNAALAGSRASLADLLGQGYEVKATSTLSLTDSKALNEENITPTVLVTLQKGPSIAVCTFGAPFWELIQQRSFADRARTAQIDLKRSFLAPTRVSICATRHASIEINRGRARCTDCRQSLLRSTPDSTRLKAVWIDLRDRASDGDFSRVRTL